MHRMSMSSNYRTKNKKRVAGLYTGQAVSAVLAIAKSDKKLCNYVDIPCSHKTVYVNWFYKNYFVVL